MKTNYKVKNRAELREIIKREVAKNQNCDLNWLDPSITDMSLLFQNLEFNGNISKWDTSNVKFMRFMFQGCPAPIPSWYQEHQG